MAQYGYLMHHGVKGMRWGVRNYQNPDGSLTEEGRRRYGTVEKYNKAMATRQKVGKVAKGLAIATGVSLATGAAIGGGIVAYQNRDKIATSMRTKSLQKDRVLISQANKLKGNKNNFDATAKLMSKVSNKAIRERWVARNADRLATSPMINNRKLASAYRNVATKAGYVEGNKMLKKVKDWNKVTGDFSKEVSKIEAGLKLIGAGAATITAVTSGVAAVKGIANTANNLYVTKDLPVVKKGVETLKEKGYLNEDSPVYKWVIDKK